MTTTKKFIEEIGREGENNFIPASRVVELIQQFEVELLKEWEIEHKDDYGFIKS